MAKRAPPAAVAKPPAGRPQAPPSNALLWAEGLLCGALVTMLPPTALLLGVLLGPAIAAMVLDRQPGKPVARSVVLCALAASVTPIRDLWAAGHGLSASLALATDPNIIGTAWSAAAAGWLLAELVPVAVRAVLEALSLSRAAQLRTARATLAEEWGLDAPVAEQVAVSVGSPPAPPRGGPPARR